MSLAAVLFDVDFTLAKPGPDLGPDGAELARLAGEQEAALRTLVQSGSRPGGGADGGEDLGAALTALADGAPEILADPLTRQVRESLSQPLTA